MPNRAAAKSKTKTQSLSTQARALDTRKRALPVSAKSAVVARREVAKAPVSAKAPPVARPQIRKAVPVGSKSAAMSLKDVVRARVQTPAGPPGTVHSERNRVTAHADIRARLQQLAGTSRPVSAPVAQARTLPSGVRPVTTHLNPRVAAAIARTTPSAATAQSPRPSVAPRTGVPKTQLPSHARILAAAEQNAKIMPADSRRRYPRAGLEVQARLTLTDDPTKSFEAALATTNISVGGMFVRSSFFLKLGTKLSIELKLPPHGRVVRVKGEVVRVETRADEETGFALHFTEYFESSEVALATHFLSPVLREFIAEYAGAHGFTADADYLAHTADLLAAWELKKAELGGDVWALTATSE